MMVGGSAARTGSCHNAPATPKSSKAPRPLWVQDFAAQDLAVQDLEIEDLEIEDLEIEDFRRPAGSAGGCVIGIDYPPWPKPHIRAENRYCE